MQNIQIAEHIKIQCKTQNITIKELLLHCGINRNFMYDLEKKEKAPSVDKICKIADYLDCSVDYLLTRTDNPDSHKL